MTMVGMADGSVRGVSNGIGAAMRHGLITPAGGEILDLDGNAALPTAPEPGGTIRKR